MQDPQNNLSTSSFRGKQKLLLKQVAMFFIPIVLGYAVIELLVLNLPANYKNNSTYFKENKENIEIMVLGSSQMDGDVNPAFFDKPGICLASASQHHKLDFTILKQLLPETKNLKYVVLELSYSHLELPHNSNEFWKNSIYLKYYNINAFERKTYFKDTLVFLANPKVYSERLVDYYLLGKEKDRQLNKYGFNVNSFNGIFKENNYDEEAIIKLKRLPNQIKNDVVFKHNTTFLYSMIGYLIDRDIHVIITTLPLYKTYRAALNPEILKRRDSILTIIKEKYPQVTVFETESDSITFKITDFNNGNHLNSRGAEKYTKKLNDLINSLE